MIRNLLTGSAALLYYICAFAFVGLALPKKWRGSRFYDVFLLGFPVYYALFQIVGLSMKLLDMPLHVLTAVWAVLMAACVLFVLLKRRGDFSEWVRGGVKDLREEPWEWAFLCLTAAVVILLVLNANHLSYYDHSYYVGIVESSVWSDTIEQVDMYTGLVPNAQRAFYLLNTDTVQNAVVCRLFRLRSLVHADYTLTAVFVTLFFLYLHKAGEQLFRKGRRYAVCFTFFTALILLFSFSAGGTSMYFTLRPYEGKAIESYLILPAVFTFFLVLYFGENAAFARTGLLSLSVASAAFSNTGIYMTQALVSALLIPYCIYRKSRKDLLWYLLIMVPSLLWVAALMITE